MSTKRKSQSFHRQFVQLFHLTGLQNGSWEMKSESGNRKRKVRRDRVKESWMEVARYRAGTNGCLFLWLYLWLTFNAVQIGTTASVFEQHEHVTLEIFDMGGNAKVFELSLCVCVCVCVCL